MKRIISLLIVAFMFFGLCACKDKKTPAPTDYNIDNYAEAGVIPEVTVKLGTSINETKEKYASVPLSDEENGAFKASDEAGEVELQIIEGNIAVRMMSVNISFYYEKENADHGISVIALTGGNAYGFELGSVVTASDVQNAVKAKSELKTATEEQQYFLPSATPGCQILSYQYNTYRLDFFFTDGFLSAVAMTDTAYWTD